MKTTKVLFSNLNFKDVIFLLNFKLFIAFLLKFFSLLSHSTFFLPFLTLVRSFTFTLLPLSHLSLSLFFSLLSQWSSLLFSVNSFPTPHLFLFIFSLCVFFPIFQSTCYAFSNYIFTLLSQSRFLLNFFLFSLQFLTLSTFSHFLFPFLSNFSLQFPIVPSFYFVCLPCDASLALHFLTLLSRSNFSHFLSIFNLQCFTILSLALCNTVTFLYFPSLNSEVTFSSYFLTLIFSLSNSMFSLLNLLSLQVS